MQYSATVAAALCCRGRRKNRPLMPFRYSGGLGDLHRGIVFEGSPGSFSGWAERTQYSTRFWDQPRQCFEDVGVFGTAWVSTDGPGQAAQAGPRLDPYTDQIDQWLLEDKLRPRKQRHTAKRVFERLRDACGFSGGHTIVKDYVRGQKRGSREMLVPLSGVESGRGQNRIIRDFRLESLAS